MEDLNCGSIAKARCDALPARGAVWRPTFSGSGVFPGSKGATGMKLPKKFKPHPHQVTGFEGIFRHWDDGHRAVLYVLPPGGGKTWLYLMVASWFVERGLRVCVVAPTVSLVQQTLDKVAETGCAHGVVWAGHKPAPEHLLQVASAQTLVNRLDEYAFDLIVLDEAHHASAPTWLKILKHYGSAKVLGVTATPKRLDGMGLDQAGFTALIEGPNVPALTPKYLSPYHYYAPSNPDLSDVPLGGRDYNPEDLAGHVDFRTLVGDAVGFYRRETPGQRALVYCVSVPEAIATAEAFCGAGYKAVAIHGKTPLETRKKALSDLRSGNGVVELICSCEVIGEGIDVPGVEVVIMLRPTHSLSVYVQQGGRGLRADPSRPEKVLRIHDHTSNWIRFRGLDAERNWRLDGTVTVSDEEEARATGRRCCAQCLLVAVPDEVGCCPACGAVMAASNDAGSVRAGGRAGYQWVEGELVRVDGGWEFPNRQKKKVFVFHVCDGSFSLGVDERIARMRFENAVATRTKMGRDPLSIDEAREWFGLGVTRKVKPANTWTFPELCSRGYYTLRVFGISAILGKDKAVARARFDSASKRMMAAGRQPRSKEELHGWLGLNPPVKKNPGKTYVTKDGNSWAFSRFLNGETWCVRAHPRTTYKYVAALAAAADEQCPRSCTENEWRAALRALPKGVLPQSVMAQERKAARKKAYEEKLAALALKRAEREKNKRTRAACARPGEFPYLQSRRKNGKAQYYIRRNRTIFILGCDFVIAQRRYESARGIWLKTGQSWPSDEDTVRQWLGLEPKHG